MSKERWPVVGSGGATAQWRVLFEGRNVDAISLLQTLQATGGGNHAQRERARKRDEENQGNSSGLTAGEGPRMKSPHRSLRTGQVWGGGLREMSTHRETSRKTRTDSKKKTHSQRIQVTHSNTWHLPLALGGSSFWLWSVSDCLISF